MNKDEQIDLFLNGTLSKEEVADFEKQLKKDPELREMLAFQLSLRRSIREEERKEVRNILDGALKDKRPVRRLKAVYRLAAAAAVLALIVVGARLFFQRPESVFSDEEALAEVQNIIDRNQVELRNAGGSNKIELLREFQVELSEKTNPCDYKDLNYYVGVYHLFVLKDFRTAAAELECVAAPQNGGQHFRPDVPRLLIIAYTGAGDYDKAISLLEEYQVPADSLPDTVLKRLQRFNK